MGVKYLGDILLVKAGVPVQVTHGLVVETI
jgi:hypothetical protein